MNIWDHDDHLGDLMSGFVDGELNAADRGLVAVHLNECSRCEHEMSEIRATRRALRFLPAVEPPDAYIDRVISDVARSQVIFEFDTADEPIEFQLRHLDHRRGRRRVGVSLSAAAALVALLIASSMFGQSSADASSTQVSQASRQHATAVASLVGSGTTLQDTAPFVMPEVLSEVPSNSTSPVTTAHGSSLPAPFQAPKTLTGGYVLVDAIKIERGFHLVYAKGDLGLSIFLEEGHIELSALPPGGTKVAFGSDVAWRWEDSVIAGRVVVGQHGGVVITAIGDEPGDGVLRAARDFPEPRTRSALSRMRRLAERVIDRINPAN